MSRTTTAICEMAIGTGGGAMSAPLLFLGHVLPPVLAGVRSSPVVSALHGERSRLLAERVDRLAAEQRPDLQLVPALLTRGQVCCSSPRERASKRPASRFVLGSMATT